MPICALIYSLVYIFVNIANRMADYSTNCWNTTKEVNVC